ncbi:hypothetical protein BT96DRAFT_998092 [Gymnopus androsaceus JB14]|uniref:Uncharacterized protein n=1 Tax=Gymnopus androsaceus JB14 TaxID=1447944 RepID=A0A6A4H9S6_9AGAR|nr:hypothetical protein BT96DRAFT_998092 [Gymnopus androsaceus JB14]
MAKRIARAFKFFHHNKDKGHNTTPTGSRVPTPTPDASTPLQVHAAPTSIADGNQPESTSVQNSSNHQGIGTTIGGTLDAALKVLKEVSAPLLPLQAAVGGVCACIGIYKDVSDNTEQLKNLVDDLTSRTTFLQLYMDRAGFGATHQIVQDLIK